jgi:DNA uptake protein ComE-like DNA-binding protein
MDDEMLEQTLMESGEKIYLEIQTASQKEITEVLDYFKTQKSNVSKINSQKAAKAIVEQREKSKINNLNFLAKKGCGIGKATVTKIEDFLLIK